MTQHDGIDLGAFEAHLNIIYPNRSTDSLPPGPVLYSNSLMSPAAVPHSQESVSAPNLNPEQSASVPQPNTEQRASVPQAQTEQSVSAAQPKAEQSASPPAESVRPAVLSQSAFSNPQDFLQVLKKDFAQIAKSDPDKISKDDLVQYSEHGADPQGRLAAAIAAAHYDQFQAMSPDLWKGKGITKKKLDDDLQLVSGDTQKLQADESSQNTEWIGGGMALGGLLAKVGPKCESVPPLEIGLSVLAAVDIGLTVYLMKRDFTMSSGIKKLAMSEQQTIKTWL
jgi:hypothetical protein